MTVFKKAPFIICILKNHEGRSLRLHEIISKCDTDPTCKGIKWDSNFPIYS